MTTFTAPPTAPSRSDPSTFTVRSDAWLEWMETTHVPEIANFTAAQEVREQTIMADVALWALIFN